MEDSRMTMTASDMPAIAFSRNYLPFEVTSDNYIAAAAVKSVNFWVFTAAVAADDEILIAWTGGAVQLTAKASPDDSGNEFPTGDGLNTYVTALAAWMQSIFLLDQAYVITADTGGADPKLVFTARKAGPDFDFTVENGGATGVTTGGVTDEPITNFAHHIEAWIKNADDADYKQAYTANVPLDEPKTGATTIDISDSLHGFLAPDLPELNDPFAFCTQSIRPYLVKYGQYYGDNPFVRKISFTGTLYIAKGGMSIQNAKKRTLLQEMNPMDDATKWRFLRQGSINKIVSTDQPEWLTWINLTGADKSVDFEVKIYNDDTTSFTFNAVAAQAVNAWQKIQFQTGFTQLDIAARQELKTPIYYTVALKSAGSYLTLLYAYVIDYTYRPWPRYFVYENSYGAFQTIGTVGKGLNEYDRTKDDAQLVMNQNRAAIDGDFLECNIRIQEKGTVNIGYDRAGQRNSRLLRDFLLSPFKTVWQDAALVPIGLDTKNLKDAGDGINVYASSFEYFPLYPEQVWTEDAGISDDDINELLGDTGGPVTSGGGTGGGTGGTGTGDVIMVDFGDAHLGEDGDSHQTYTAPALAGLDGYAVFSTQLSNYFRPAEISYDSAAGSFTILIDGFALENGEQLIISPYVINPDA
jgi:hypothetical protein